MVEKRAVAVVIVNYNSAEFLGRCLESLVGEQVELIIVVDNASQPSDSERARLMCARVGAIFHSSPSNLGFGAAVNLGGSLAVQQGEFDLWVLNPDVEVIAGAAAELSGAIGVNDRSIVSPVILTRDDKAWFVGGEIDAVHGTAVHVGFGKQVDLPTSDPFPTRFVTGAAPMISFLAWQVLGGFREDLFLYWEDVDLSIRAKSADVSLRVVPRASVRHAEGGSSKDADDEGLSRTYYFFMQRNRLIVLGGKKRARLALLGGLAQSLKMIMKPLVVEKVDRIGKFRSSIAGMIAGVKGDVGPR